MINVKTVALKSLPATKTDLAVFVPAGASKIVGASGLSQAARSLLLTRLNEDRFKGAPNEVASFDLQVLGHVRRIFAVGVGSKKLGPEDFRRAAGHLMNAVLTKRAELFVLCSEHTQAIAEGLMLASYRFEEYRKADRASLLSVAFVAENTAAQKRLEQACAKAGLYCEAVAYARDLINRAPSDKAPAELGKIARQLAGPRITVEVIDHVKAERLGMGALLAVGRGAAQPPVMVHMVYKPKAPTKSRVALVGKGVTFDSGGLSIKTPLSMEKMKCDMAGAAEVLAAFKVIERLAPKAEVHGIFAAACNMLGPDAMKPGDVLTAMNGKTIEVWDTDAEGRLVLADALSLAVRQKPQAIIDLATLTGAVFIAVGSKVSGLMGNDRRLTASVFAAGKRADESFFEFPRVEDYRERIRGNIADLLNMSKVDGEAGTITAGLFLEEFVASIPWVHLDIASTAFSLTDHSSYAAKGATGIPVRTLLEWLSAL